MKQVDKTNRMWFEKNEKGTTSLGFTKEFLEKLQECFHIVPGKKIGNAIRENGPLLAIETNEGLFSIPSPTQGIMSFFNDKAMNFPDRLTEEDVICQVVDKMEKKEKVATNPSMFTFNQVEWDNIARNVQVQGGLREAPVIRLDDEEGV